MDITLANGKKIRGDILRSAVLRYDLAPVPATLEAEIRADSDMRKQLKEGKLVTVNGNDFRIFKIVGGSGGDAQGKHDSSAVHIIALLDACAPVVLVRKTAIIKESALLTEIYRASGAQIKPVTGDFKADRFVCMVGETPSFLIAKTLQEEGGVVRWKGGKLNFLRLADLFKQKPVISLTVNAAESIDSQFIQRHEIPSYYSISPTGEMIYGNRTKARSAIFVQGKNKQQLVNMSRCLVRRKTAKIDYNHGILAGDIVEFIGDKPLTVVTAAHVIQTGTDGSGSNQYTKLWLSSMEG